MLGLGRARTNREHRFAQDNLSAYMDGELRPAERARLERHLAGCADCRRDLEALRGTVALLRRAPLKPVPRSFALPASARAVQTRHRRWNRAFAVMRTATITIATMLVVAFAGDAALSTGLVRGSRAPAPDAVLLAHELVTVPAEKRVEPMTAEAAPYAAPLTQPSEAAEPYVGGEATPAAGGPVPSETARALQPPRETWPGPEGQPQGTEGFGEGAGGLGGEGGAGGGADMGGAVPAVPRTNGVGGGAESAEAERIAEETAEVQVESLAESAEAQDTPLGEPRPEALAAPALAPTPTPEPTQAPMPKPTAAAEAEASPVPALTDEALVMEVEPQHVAPDRGGEAAAQAEPVMPLERQPESSWWQAWRLLRLVVGLLAGLLLVALAGTIWAAYERGTL